MVVIKIAPIKDYVLIMNVFVQLFIYWIVVQTKHNLIKYKNKFKNYCMI